MRFKGRFCEFFPKATSDFTSDLLYEDLCKHFGEILIQVDNDGYQGDSRMLLKKDNKYGHLIFGWGSCPGCDTLQAACTEEDVEHLMKSLYNGIVWKKSKEDMLEYLTNKGWTTGLEWYAEETRLYIQKVKDYLTQEAK